MAIEFRCPNGHRLSCPVERAGRVGKCPKCQADFKVPPPGEAPISASDSGVSEPQLEPLPGDNPGAELVTAELPAASDAAVKEEAPGKEETIAFLCPTGHRLTAPATLQGRPGKCPHCGAKFLVPRLEEEADDDNYLEAAAPADGLDAETDLADDQHGHNGAHAAESSGDFPFDFRLLEEGGYAGHGMAQLFARLWGQRGLHGVIDLHLKGGDVLSPDWYSSRLSRESYGVFAAADKDGSYTVSAVNWDAVERVTVRGIEELPPGAFDED